MEDDRAEGNLGIAADLEENQEPVVQRQPKKRFVGRRAAAENAAKGAPSGTSIENAVQGEFILLYLRIQRLILYQLQRPGEHPAS
jgi:2-(3-amino-3-carboxypropyl)histidine synthase